MVPYVRKSFFKHFKDGLRYVDGHGPLMIEQVLKEVNNSTPIDEYPVYLQRSRSYQYAMDMTTREVSQAVEGLYHNLNY